MPGTDPPDQPLNVADLLRREGVAGRSSGRRRGGGRRHAPPEADPAPAGDASGEASAAPPTESPATGRRSARRSAAAAPRSAPSTEPAPAAPPAAVSNAPWPASDATQPRLPVVPGELPAPAPSLAVSLAEQLDGASPARLPGGVVPDVPVRRGYPPPVVPPAPAPSLADSLAEHLDGASPARLPGGVVPDVPVRRGYPPPVVPPAPAPSLAVSLAEHLDGASPARLPGGVVPDVPVRRGYPPPVPEEGTAADEIDEPETEEAEPAAPRRGSWRKRHPALVAAIVLGVVLALGVGYYATVLLVAQNRITRESVLRADGPEILEPQLQTDTQTYLIVVSDSAAKSKAAEVTALAHLSADESRLVIVSFPRETLVDVPDCGSATTPVPAFTSTLATAYAKGGGRCSVAAVQALTGIRINHYLGVDLARFPGMIDSLGGVSVCLTAPLRDPDNDVSLPAGETELTGTQATNYVRAVAGGASNDPARASRQISFLSTVFSDALGASTLANPIRVTEFAFAVADVLTLDPTTSLGDLRDLGSNLRDLSAGRQAGKVSIVVPPLMATGSGDSATAGYEQLDPDQSRAMFDAIIAGQPLPDVASQPPASTAPADPSGAGTSAATTSAAPVVSDC